MIQAAEARFFAVATARVVLIGGMGGDYTGGVNQFEIEATTLYDVISALDARYPGLGNHLEEEAAVAIDGEIHNVGYYHPVPPGCEVFFIPKIEGG